MDSSTLLWTVDATRGSVNFGRLIPFAGNTYKLVFVGVALEEVYTAYVMDESGLKCLAKSEHNAGEYKIAFNTADLRDEFERNMHEVQTFHVIVRDSKRVVAEGDLSVQWQSLWEDTTTGEVFTMRGPKGEPGAPGRKGDPGSRGSSAYEIALMNGFDGSEEDWLKTLKGVPGSLVRVQKIDENGEETGKWHNVFVKPDQNGRLRIVIGKTEYESNAFIVGNIEGNVVGNLKGTAEKAIADSNGKKIHETYLPLTGGNMTGAISFVVTDGVIKNINDAGRVIIFGGTAYNNGAALYLLHKNNDNANKGGFALQSHDGTNSAYLVGSPNGKLTWDGNNIVRSIRGIKADNDGDVWLEFLKLMDSSYSTDTEGPMLSIGDPSGAAFIMQSGVVESVDSTDGATVTFDVPFRDMDYVVICQQIKDAATGGGVAVKSKSTTGFTLVTYSNSIDVMWFAFGYPKN